MDNHQSQGNSPRHDKYRTHGVSGDSPIEQWRKRKEDCEKMRSNIASWEREQRRFERERLELRKRLMTVAGGNHAEAEGLLRHRLGAEEYKLPYEFRAAAEAYLAERDQDEEWWDWRKWAEAEERLARFCRAN